MDIGKQIQQAVLDTIESSGDLNLVNQEIEDTQSLINYALKQNDEQSKIFVKEQTAFLDKCKALKLKFESPQKH